MTSVFNKQQREVLKSLSVKVYGASSKWQKLYSSNQLRVPVGINTVTETQYVTRNGSTLIANGKKEVQKPVYGQPTYEDLVHYLEIMWDSRVMTTLATTDAQGYVCVFAKRYMEKTLVYNFVLRTEPGDEEEVKKRLRALGYLD